MVIDGRATLRTDGVVRSFGHGSRSHRAVDDVNLTVTNQTRLGIVGESGSGKSTLGLMLVGLERPTSGAVIYNGQDVQSLVKYRARRMLFRREVQMITQDTSSSFDPLRTLRDAVSRPAQQLAGLDRSSTRDRVDETVAMLGLDPSLADRYPQEVSGGQRQRFAIARALVVRPRFIVCDEVVSALDVSVQGQVLNQLKEYCTTHNTGLAFISHGLPATAFISNELLVMHQGKVVETGPTQRVIEAPEHPYTARLLAAYRQGNRTPEQEVGT
ncbi:ABC transporter ATP-binding protein [Microbacterium aquimaris]|uniref:ATP-binding cassette domain-containing protein n=1 Tax=Microbacterium aquimaris TaxID=459816 RepID=A0ABU5N5D0_9MICO|nr:ATP-binding cassette domain-containing protein [Microbacterium aquimaris]MDZ8161275.1 ATP-binding cassette domain-containing protein [Microbacterium aquimaris]